MQTDIETFSAKVDAAVAQVKRAQSLPPKAARAAAPRVTNRAADPTQKWLDAGMTRTQAWREYDRIHNPEAAAATAPAKTVRSERLSVPPGFSSPENYEAFRKAEAAGRCSVHGGCQTFPAYKSNR